MGLNKILQDTSFGPANFRKSVRNPIMLKVISQNGQNFKSSSTVVTRCLVNINLSQQAVEMRKQSNLIALALSQKDSVWYTHRIDRIISQGVTMHQLNKLNITWINILLDGHTLRCLPGNEMNCHGKISGLHYWTTNIWLVTPKWVTCT